MKRFAKKLKRELFHCFSFFFTISLLLFLPVVSLSSVLNDMANWALAGWKRLSDGKWCAEVEWEAQVAKRVGRQRVWEKWKAIYLNWIKVNRTTISKRREPCKASSNSSRFLFSLLLAVHFFEWVFGGFAKKSRYLHGTAWNWLFGERSRKWWQLKWRVLLDDVRYIVCDLFRCKMNINAIWFNKTTPSSTETKFCIFSSVFFSLCCAFIFVLIHCCCIGVVFVFGAIVVNLISSEKDEIFAAANFILRAINQEHLLGVPASLLIVVLHFGICINFAQRDSRQMKKTMQKMKTTQKNRSLFCRWKFEIQK